MRARSFLLPVAVCLASLASAACGSTPSSDPGDRATAPSSSDSGPTQAAPGNGGSASAPDAGGSATSAPGQDGGAAQDGATPPPVCPPSWTVTPACGGGTSAAAPDFGPNVLVFDPSMSSDTIQQQLDTVYSQQDSAQFGTGRYAYFFKPGNYNLDVKVGFYTQVFGLGQSPDDVQITGAVRSKADWLGNNNATCNFWRGAENLAITPTASIDSNVNRWAVSQGTELRRIHVRGNLALDDGGWSSGGFVADSVIDGAINSGTQQQFLTRNVDQSWQGSNWNMVFVGDGQPPSASWPAPPYTVVAATPVVREKPFLYVDGAGNYLVMVPNLKSGSAGHSWASGAAPGAALSIDRFYLAKPATDTAATINAALAQGQNVIFTPGIYHLSSSLEVTRPGTIVMGLGIATLVADSGTPLLSVADVGGVTVAGLLLEAGPTSSPTLLELDPSGSAADHGANPSVVFDVHCRVGGASVGTAKSCLTVNSRNTVIDHTWLWRADHGAGADWNTNKSANGIVVNGDDVTVYGLFSEHFQEYQTLWNGNGGAVYFYQSEMPYDPPNQAAWQAAPGHNGYPSYKVADAVTTHHAEGLGVYGVFTNDVAAENAIESPAGAGISLHHMMTVSLASGSITHIVNDTGGTVGSGGSFSAFSGD